MLKMTLQQLDTSTFTDFIEYCREYRFEHDESYLCESELVNFVIGEENPTFLLYESTQLVGVASVKIMPHINGLRRGRIRLLHTRINRFYAKKAYILMVKALITRIRAIDHLFCLFPEDRKAIIRMLIKLGFCIERYPCLLTRESKPISAPVFKEGFYVKAVERLENKVEWLKVRNEAMKGVKGSEAPEELSHLEEFLQDEGQVAGGMMLLYHEENPIGCARIVCETDEGNKYTFIDTIAIVPDYQNQGLGRQFLRHCIQFGMENDMPYAMLSVNAENKRATQLYVDEGFELVEVMTCLNYLF